MTALDLAAVRNRADAATPGPWVGTANGRVLGPPRPQSAYERDIAATAINGGDTEFIAHAREDIPALVTEVERLRSLADAVQARDEQITELKDRIAARDRASLAALFLADAIGIENVESEIEKAKAAVVAPYLERIAALQAQLDALRQTGGLPIDEVWERWRAILADAPSDVLDRVKREAAAAERREWADYLESWEATVGSPVLTASRLVALLREPRRPFGAVANKEAQQ